MQAHWESASLAKQLIEVSSSKQPIRRGEFTVRANRGPLTTSKPLAPMSSIARRAARPVVRFWREKKEQFRLFRFRSAIARFLRRHARPLQPKSTVLVWDLGNFPEIVARNGLFATALKVRGQRTHTILCDGTPVACVRRGIELPEVMEEWPRKCAQCSRDAMEVARKYCLDVSWVGEYVSEARRREFLQIAESLPLNEILEYVHLGTNAGWMAWSSLNRHMKGLLIDPAQITPEQALIFRKYLYAALVNVHAANEATTAHSPVSVLTSHGIYVDFAPPMMIAFQKGLAAVSWSSAYADGHHYFTVLKGADQPLYQGISSSEPWQQRAATPLTAAEEERLNAFLHHRYFRSGARDIGVVSGPESAEALRRKIGLRPGKPVFCVFAHVNWDVCLGLSSAIFANSNVWIIETIKRVMQNTAVDWIIRIHPSERTDGTILSTADVINAEFPRLPGHIKVLTADSDINSYGLYQLIDGGITIFGTVGIELTSMGKPAIVAGQAHYANKGFTIDSASAAEYFGTLDRAASIAPLGAEQTALARRYAYWFFVQRHIPIRSVDLKQGHWGDLDLARIEMLLPGRDRIMDSVCRNIVEGKDFILPSDMVLGG